MTGSPSGPDTSDRLAEWHVLYKKAMRFADFSPKGCRMEEAVGGCARRVSSLCPSCPQPDPLELCWEGLRFREATARLGRLLARPGQSHLTWV